MDSFVFFLACVLVSGLTGVIVEVEFIFGVFLGVDVCYLKACVCCCESV